MALAETAQLAVLLTLKDQMSSGIASAEAQLGGLNRTAGTSGAVVAKTGGLMAGVKVAAVGMAGGLNHAKTALGGLLSGPLGMIGLGAGLFTIGGIVTGSVKKLEDFTLSLEAVRGLTGETAQSAGALILQFEKFGLSGDRIAQIAGFAEKTLGKLNETQAKGTKAAKSAELQNLELVKAQRQAAGASTTAINRLISEQKAKDQLAAHTVAGMTKLQALDKQYGLSLVDNKGKAVSFSVELAQIADLYDRNIPASEKAYVASQVFGRGYAALIPILQQGSAGIRSASKDAAALGLDLGGDTVAKMNKFRDMMRTLGEQANILQMRIGLALIPAFTDLATAAGTWLSSGGSEQIVGFFKDATKFAGSLVAAARPVATLFGMLAQGWNALPGELKAVLVGGFVLNKASNMLFGTGLKGILGGAGNVLGAMRGSSPATPLFVSDVGKGLGGLAGGAAGAAEGAGGMGLAAIVTTMVPVLLAGAAGAAVVQWMGGFDPSKSFGAKGGGTGRTGGFASAAGGSGGTGGASGPRVAAAYGLGLPRVAGSFHPVESGDVRDAAYYLATHIGIDIANAVRHAKLNAEIQHKGAKFLEAGLAGGAKTLDVNAGKLVQLFQTSTNPSLASMRANLGNMQRDFANGDVKTRQALGNDIAAMKLMITAAINALPGAIAALGGVNFSQTPAQQRDRRGVTVHVNTSVSSAAIARNKAVVERSGGLRSLSGNIGMAGG